jgi:hypothetical protein
MSRAGTLNYFISAFISLRAMRKELHASTATSSGPIFLLVEMSSYRQLKICLSPHPYNSEISGISFLISAEI